MLTIIFPWFSILRASCRAAHATAPLLIPTESPSLCIIWIAVATASWSETGIMRSMRSTRNVSGWKPAPSPSILCGPGRPPERTAQVAGSTATISTSGLRERSPSATPVRVPPVPTPITTISTAPAVSSQISTAVPSRWARGFAWL